MKTKQKVLSLQANSNNSKLEDEREPHATINYIKTRRRNKTINTIIKSNALIYDLLFFC